MFFVDVLSNVHVNDLTPVVVPALITNSPSGFLPIVEPAVIVKPVVFKFNVSCVYEPRLLNATATKPSYSLV